MSHNRSDLAIFEDTLNDSNDCPTLLDLAKPLLNNRNAHGRSPLHLAIPKHPKLAEELIKISDVKTLNAQDNYGITALIIAVDCDDLQLVNMLLERKADPTLANMYGIQAIHNAARSGSIDTLTSLVKYGADINALDGQHTTPFFHAVLKGQYKLVEHLLKEYVVNKKLLNNREIYLEIDKKNIFGVCPIHEAARLPSIAIFKLLIKHGLNIFVLTNKNQTVGQFINPVRFPKRAAFFSNYLKNLDALINRVIDETLNFEITSSALTASLNNEPIYKIKHAIEGACQQFNLTEKQFFSLAKMLKPPKTPQLETKEKEIKTEKAFHIDDLIFFINDLLKEDSKIQLKSTKKIPEEKITVTSLSTQKTIEINKNAKLTDAEGNTILHLAAQLGELAVIHYIVSKNLVDINATNKQGHTALVLALWNKQILAAEMLAKRCECTKNNINTYHALHLAAEFNFLNILQILLERGAAVDTRLESDGVTPLLRALMNKHENLATYLITTWNANVNISYSKENYTPLHIAAYLCSFETVKLLVEHNADITARTTTTNKLVFDFADPENDAKKYELLKETYETSIKIKNLLQENAFDILKKLLPTLPIYLLKYTLKIVHELQRPSTQFSQPSHAGFFISPEGKRFLLKDRNEVDARDKRNLGL